MPISQKKTKTISPSPPHNSDSSNVLIEPEEHNIHK